MATYVIYANTGSGVAYSGDATYASARDGTGSSLGVNVLTFSNSMTNTLVAGPFYQVNETFWLFDTSATGSGSLVSVELSLTQNTAAGSGSVPCSFRYYTWSTPLVGGDFRSAAAASALTVAGTYTFTANTAGLRTSTFSDTSGVNRSGNTTLVGVTDTHVAGTAPANNDQQIVTEETFAGGSSTDPYLTIETGASAALTGTITSSATESDIVAGGKTIILTLTNGTWIPA